MFNQACEKYSTSIMKCDEVLLFIEAALENNGGDMKQAYSDMHLIDDLLHIERLHIVCSPLIRKTRSGHYRRGGDIYTSLDKRLDSEILNNK